MPRKKKEVSVKPPPFPSIEEPEIVKDTIEEERPRVFSIAKRIGGYLSGLMITVGAVLSFLSFQYLFSPFLNVPGFIDIKALLTQEFIIIATGFLGLLNIICGFILLAKK